VLAGLLVTTLVSPAASASGLGLPAPGARPARLALHLGQPLSADRSPTAALGSAIAAARQRAGLVRLGVDLRPGADVAAVASVAATLGGSMAQRLDRIHFVSLSVPAAAVAAVATALSQRPDVVAVAPVATRHADDVPNDTLWSSESSYLDAVSAPAAWDVTHGSAAVKVAIIDTGVDVGHPDLAGKVVATHDAMAGAASTVDVTDNVGHGTHVAGIVAAATNNATGVAGVGFDTSLMAVKAGDDGGFTDDDIAQAILWAANNGARIINMSLGGAGSTAVLSNAVSYAQAAGVLVVAAAGNEHSTALSYPAAYPGVIAVGATDAAGHRASFSNYGSWVTVGAPGVGLWSTVPTAGSSGFPAPTSGYGQDSGTSMASPVVAGEAALLVAAGPSNLTNSALRNAIVSSASGYAGLGLGTGQIDLAAALTKLPPSTMPTLTGPAPAAIVGGTATLTASSSGTSVGFYRDGVSLGAPVTVSGGVASFPWQTWGVADGAHDLTVADCNANGCGTPSSATSVTVQNAAPSVTSPAADAVVSNVVGVDVTTQNAPPAVRLMVDGLPVGAPVAVVGDAAHLTWTTYGLVNGAHTVGAAVCDSVGACGSSGSVSVTVTNAAPTITSPKVGQVASGLFTVSATAPGGGVVFLLGTTKIGSDTSSPYSVPVNFSSFADGTYTLTVKSCSQTLSLCNGPTVARSITVKSLHPALAATAVFSPNGDKRLDVMSGTVTLASTQKVYWTVRNAAGTVVSGSHLLGYLAAGKHGFTWNGLSNAGKRVPDGLYTVQVSTSNATSTKPATLFGWVSRQVRVDDTAPVMSVTALSSGFYPYPDGYRDTIAPKVTVNERGTLSMIIKNSAGKVVRTIVVNHSAAGTFTMTWNGIITGNVRAPAGTYKYFFLAQDLAQNRRSTVTYSVYVSAAKLVGTAVSTTVTPAASKTQLVIGSCSALFNDPTWSGGYDYESGYDFFQYGACPDPSDPYLDVVGSEHQLTLHSAVRYAGLSVVATGHEEEAGFGDEAYGWYRDTSGNLVGNGATLGTALGSYSLGAAPTTLLYGGKTLRWTVATNVGQYYAIKSFTVHYTYYVLK
jgi:subtilisin family serine protease/flagellar hook assembly protein FlgD